ncbi:MAG: type II toxin-antitoxin system Phd/YefM family antitoxin [Gemmatimonadaceae bacterium]
MSGIVENTQEPVLVGRRGHQAMAILPAEELEGIPEMAHLLRSPKNAARLLTALQRALRGQTGEALSVRSAAVRHARERVDRGISARARLLVLRHVSHSRDLNALHRRHLVPVVEAAEYRPVRKDALGDVVGVARKVHGDESAVGRQHESVQVHRRLTGIPIRADYIAARSNAAQLRE